MFCTKCQQFWQEAIARANVPDFITSCEDVKWSSYEVILHTSLRQLKLSSDARCMLCRIIYHTPTEYEHQRILHDIDAPLNISLDIDPTKGPHPVLSVAYCDASGDGIKVPKRMVAACGGLLTDEKTTAALRCSIELPNESTGSDGALQLAAYWLKTCLSSHNGCRPSGIRKDVGFLPTRLIDVSNDKIRLVETKGIADDDDRRYVALSHCWGKVRIIRTLKENYESHLAEIDLASLSQTFKDAVHATRKLEGLRYLWIDSLCIIQDDGDDWAAEAATMCDVYQNATLTIAAAHAAGGDVGCFEIRDGLLQMPIVIDIPQKGVEKQVRIAFTSYGRGQGLGGPEPPLYGRAWVLQEQLLSPRMLVFDGPQLRWECLTMHASERSHTGGMSRHAGHQKAIRQGIMNDKEFFDNPESKDQEFGARMQHENWCDAVMDYTHRGMTQSKDRLVALAGTAQALGRHTKSEYHAGLWSRFFWAGLLWSIPYTREYPATTTDAFDLENNKTMRHATRVAPSWSWASVTAPVVYGSPAIVYLDPICDIRSISTSGSAASQAGRIKIHGHIRKGYVNAIYPYAIREAAAEENHLSHMQMDKPEGQKDLMIYKGRAIPPNDYFLFSEKRPTKPRLWMSNLNPTLYYTKHWDWKLVRGKFRPDQIIAPTTEITFLAIAQQHDGRQLTSILSTHKSDDPLTVNTIALIPSDSENGTYKRVGYAVWSDCAWYGYNCALKKGLRGVIERPGKWTKEYGWEVKDGVWDTLDWWMKWENLELYKAGKRESHEHVYVADALPDLKRYNKSVGIEEKMVVIV